MPLPWSGQLGGTDRRARDHVGRAAREPARRPRRTAPVGVRATRLRRQRTDRLPVGLRHPGLHRVRDHVGQPRRRTASRSPRPPTPLFASGQAPPCIVVWVDAWTAYGGSQFVDSPGTGRYHTYLCDDVVPFVDARYRTLDAPAPPGHPGEVERRLRGHDHAHAPARPVRRPRHARRRRALRVLLHPRVPQDGAGACAPATATSRRGGRTSAPGRRSRARTTTCCSWRSGSRPASPPQDDGTPVLARSTPTRGGCATTCGRAGWPGTRSAWCRTTPTRCDRCGRCGSTAGRATSGTSISAPSPFATRWRRSASPTCTSSSSTPPTGGIGWRYPLALAYLAQRLVGHELKICSTRFATRPPTRASERSPGDRRPHVLGHVATHARRARRPS